MAGRENNRTKGCYVTMHDTQCVAPTRYSIVCFEGVFILLALLCLFFSCTYSWGACSTGNAWCRYEQENCGGDGFPDKPSGVNYAIAITYDKSTCRHRYGRWESGCQAAFCSTQEEADSVRCELNPNAPGCVVLQDTSIFVCNESFEYNYQTGQENQIYMQLYRCDCKWDATNKTGTCNGKTNVDPKIDCDLVMDVPGSCNDNGYQQGPNTDTTGSDATCYAIVNDKCHMRDNRTGNTFVCSCDGNCNYAYEQMNRGFCVNPYFSSASQDDTFDPFSSSSNPSSSGGEGGGTSSTGGEGGEGGETSSSSGEGGEVTSGSSASDPGDFEYDYTSILEAIQANTQGTMNNTRNIDANFKQLNTSVNNITSAVNSASSSIVGAVNNASSNIGGKLNTLIDDFGEYSTLWTAYKDSILHPQGDVPFDSSYQNDSIGMFHDSISRHMHDIDSILDALGDTTTNYIVFDSIYNWNDTASIKSKLGGFFFNAPASKSCPVFNFQVDDMPVMGDMDWRIDFGNFFGRVDFCELIRTLVRLGTLIAIVLGTIQAFRRAFSNGG